eukprot:9381614-Alexandrium_andersonii.AAC.1
MGPEGQAVGAAAGPARGPVGCASSGRPQAPGVIAGPHCPPDLLAYPAEQGAGWWEGCEVRGAWVLRRPGSVDGWRRCGPEDGTVGVP